MLDVQWLLPQKDALLISVQNSTTLNFEKTFKKLLQVFAIEETKK